MTQVFAFIDVDHPVVAWGAYRGVLVSANASYSPPSCPVSMMFAGIVASQRNIRLQNELLIEQYRQTDFPHCCSRLAGMYFFEDRITAERACEWGYHFSTANLAELELLPTAPPSRHDSNWITFAPLQDGKIQDETWIRKYWSGEVFPGRSPIWELIAQGRAVIYGTELRERAYANIVKRTPEAVAMLEISRIAADVDSDLGQAVAWITREDENTMNLSFYVDMKDADNPTVLQRIDEYSGPRNHKDLAVGGDFFRMPNFSEFGCKFRVGAHLSGDFVASVHRNE